MSWTVRIRRRAQSSDCALLMRGWERSAAADKAPPGARVPCCAVIAKLPGEIYLIGKADRPDFHQKPAFTAERATALSTGGHHGGCDQHPTRVHASGAFQQGARDDGAAQHRCGELVRLGAHPDEFAGPAPLVHRLGRRQRRRPDGERARRRQPAQDRGASLALEGIQRLSQPHRQHRQPGRRLADRVRRPAEHPAHQSGPQRPAAGHQHDPLRDLDLQPGRHRARPRPQPERQPHHPFRQGRLHQCRRRALRGPPRRHHSHAQRHLARPRQRGRRAGDLDRHAGLAADGVSGLRLGRPGVQARLRQQRQEPGDGPQGRLFRLALWPWRPDPDLRLAPARLRPAIRPR